ncbi:MAG: DUF5320 domain-containing protein [Candidatus Syntropharchaeia archaeon]
MVWVRGPCRCGFGPHAWIWLPTPEEMMYPSTPVYPVYPTPPPVDAVYPTPPPVDEKEILENQIKFLEGQLEQIRKRLEELKK